MTDGPLPPPPPPGTESEPEPVATPSSSDAPAGTSSDRADGPPAAPPAPAGAQPAPGAGAQPPRRPAGGPQPWQRPPGGPGPWQPPTPYPGPYAGPYRPGPPSLNPAYRPSRLSQAVSDFWKVGKGSAPGSVLLAAGAVGAGAGILVIGQRPGLGAALVGAALWLPGVPALVRRRAVVPLLLIAAAVALAAVTAVRDAPWLLTLCVIGSLGAGGAAVADARTVPALLAVPLSAGAGVLRGIPWGARGTVSRFGGRRTDVVAVVRGAAVAVVLLLVFGALLAGADDVFAAYVGGIDLDLGPQRVLLGTVVAVVATGMASLAIAPPGWGVLHAPEPRKAKLAEWLLPVGSLTAMVLFFIGIQVSALLGGHRHVLESQGLTYAEYARQGFGQLMAVTIGTLLVVSVAARRAPRSNRKERVVTAATLALLCLGTLGVVASALRRMDLYVEAFGLTRLRVFVVAVEIALGVVLLLVLVAGVRWRGEWLPRAVAGVAAITLLGLAVVNPDAMILRHNTQGALSGSLSEPLDVDYLRGLSADAVPDAARLPEPMRSCVLEGRRVPEPVDLAGWNWSRARALDALAGLEPIDDPCPQVEFVRR